MAHRVIGWDVGGVNTKVARVEGGIVRQLRSVPFEIQRAPNELGPLIAEMSREIGARPADHHAVTMTAELSQLFLTKRHGVSFVLDALEGPLLGAAIQVFGTDGSFRSPQDARREPLLTAASNWAATAAVVALTWRDAVLVDIGTTTTDIIPIRDGKVVAHGRTDPGRLLTGELLYLGAIRTPVEAIVHEVPLDGGGDGWGTQAARATEAGAPTLAGRAAEATRATRAMAGVSAESFALAGDVYLWLGEIAEEEYSAPTPDGRAASRAAARNRLARIVCADGEMLDDSMIDTIALHVARAQVERVARSLERMRSDHPSISIVVTAGIGSFLARQAAERVGMATVSLGVELGAAAARSAPAAAVAIHLERRIARTSVP